MPSPQNSTVSTPEEATPIILKLAKDLLMEQKLIEQNKCDMAVVERDNVLFISTKKGDAREKLKGLPFCQVIMGPNADGTTRFVIKASKEMLLEHLSKQYQPRKVSWKE